MERVIPVLKIDEYASAVDYYVSRLGFSIVFEHRHEPGFPVYMVIQSGDFYLGLSEHGRGHQGSEVYFIVDDIKVWHHRCVENKVVMEQAPRQMPWGNTEMLIKDPFRNALRFTQENTHPGTNTPNKQ